MAAAMCVSMFLFVLGIVSIFQKDIIWEFTDWQNRASGRVSERTSEWEMMTTLSGIVSIILAIIIIFSVP